MTYVRLSDVRLHYALEGEGEPLIYLHGFSLDLRQWLGEIEHFRYKYRVIAPDARGHGKSDAPVTGYSRDHRVEDLSGLVDTLEIDRFHLVGLSMGGATAIGYALEHPDRLRSLTLVSSGAAGYSVSKKFERLDRLARAEGVEVARQKWMDWSLAWYKDRHPEVGKRIAEMMSGFGGAVWADPRRGKYSKSVDLDRVAEIKVPTLIMAGELDKVFLELARKLHERISGSTLKVFPGVGHMVNMEAPERFREELEVFLEGVSCAR